MESRFLFYYLGKPVYEGDEMHQLHEAYKKAKKVNFQGNFAQWLVESKGVKKI